MWQNTNNSWILVEALYDFTVLYFFFMIEILSKKLRKEKNPWW